FHRLGEVQHLRVEHLDGEALAEMRVLRAVNGAHPALADELLDPVAARDDVTEQPSGIAARRRIWTGAGCSHAFLSCPAPSTGPRTELTAMSRDGIDCPIIRLFEPYTKTCVTRFSCRRNRRTSKGLANKGIRKARVLPSRHER